MSSTTLGSLGVFFKGDASDYFKALDNMQKQTEALVTKVGAQASTLANKFGSAFSGMGARASADKARAWSKAFASAGSRGEQDMLQFASAAQAMLGPMIGTGPATATMSMNLAQLSTDLSSFFNVADNEAMASLQGALIGNAEGVRKFGVTMTEASLQQFAFESGINKSVSKMTEAQKVQLRYNFIMSKTKQVQGDAAKTSQSFANTLRGITGASGDIAAQLGAVLLPAFTAVAGVVRDTLVWFRSANPVFKKFIAYGIAIATAVSGAIAAFAAWQIVLAPLMTMLGALAAPALAALGSILVPILGIMAALGAVVIAVGALRNAWETNVGGMATATKSFFSGIVKGFAAAIGWLGKTWDKFSDAFAEKLIVYKGLVTGATPEETGAQLMEARKQSGIGLFDTSEVELGIKGAFLMGADAVGDMWKGGRDMFGKAREWLDKSWDKGTDTFKDVLAAIGGKRLMLRLNRMGSDGPGPAYDPVAGDFSGSRAETPEERKARLDKEKNERERVVEHNRTSAQGAIDKGRSNAETYFSSDEGKRALRMAQPVITQIGQAATEVGGKVLGAMGDAGAIAQNAIAGFATGGPIGAVASVVGDILMRTEGFGEIATQFGNIVSVLAEAINPLIEALQPVVMIIGQLVGLVANNLGVALKAFVPIILTLTKILEPIFAALGHLSTVFLALAPLIGIVATVFAKLEPLLTGLAKVIEGVAWVISKVFYGIAWLFNGIIEVIADILTAIDKVIPGDALKNFGQELRNNQVDLAQFGKRLGDFSDTATAAAEANEDLKDSTEDVNSGVLNGPQGFKVNLERFNAAMADDVPKAARSSTGGSSMSPVSIAAAQAGPANVIRAFAQQVREAVAAAKENGAIQVQQVNVQAKDMFSLIREIQKQVADAQFRAMGSTAGGNPNATART
jgi:hypothetical protein